ncbi:TetR/AcrR family transcriptional regulator C-terminal domain-containing protein [Variovorax sp. IB41]|uniref:TetR/AcrR family transcriptional regulator C-terminal domain-containing protein n=1 Tax=Variovorax sp. IB41 TaxID=2779370 RepID=UPI0018E86577|nr:TetR/AcrR family transcriptional regulator C-terminal domain-containing protein [Variovorax sp. IB41]MBJ2154602.1 TetR/AcrR family transcriptional regulator C-terminal domain-containing protein [Variovorax sp. IB41]
MRTFLTKVLALTSSQETAPQSATIYSSRIDGVPNELTGEIDVNGSPLTIEPADWFVCFVPGLQRQWWHRFAHPKHKHVFALRMVDDDKWLLVEPWWTRLMVNVLTLDEAIKFLRWGAAGNILRVRENIPGRGTQVRGWANCTVLVSFLLGRSYWTWTPHGLYQRLAADPDATPVDLSQFLSHHFEELAHRKAESALQPLPLREAPLPLHEALTELGNGIMNATMSPSAISLYKAAVSESIRFRGAAEAFWTFGPERAVDRVCEVLKHAKGRGEIGIGLDDCAAASRQFIAMLQGNMQQEIIFGLRASPSPSEVHGHVLSVVSIFLRGARAKKWRQLARIPNDPQSAGPSKMLPAPALVSTLATR